MPSKPATAPSSPATKPKPKNVLVARPSKWKLAQPKADSSHVHFHESGHLVASHQGRRVQELEIPWPVLWAHHARGMGHDPTKFTLHTVTGKTIKILEQIDGYTFKLLA